MLLILFLFLIVLYLCARKFIERKSDSLTCLVGKTALVTGGNSGLGYATSFLLASRGCRVIIADRDNADKTVEEIKKTTGNDLISYKFLDLSSLKLTREFGEDLKKTEKKIDILINNAGIGVGPKLATEDNLNTVMQVNYFGAFLLTHLLLDLLKSSNNGRVIFLGSISIFFNNLTDKNFNLVEKDGTTSLRDLYSNSKLCCVIAAQELGKKLESTGILVNSVDPGAVKTDIFRRASAITGSLYFDVVTGIVLSIIGTDSFGGAQGIFDLAASRKLDGVTGEHFSYLMPFFKPSVLKDQNFCDKIWKRTEELVKLSPEEKIKTN